MMESPDFAILASVFQTRIGLARITAEKAAEEAILEWAQAREWIRSDSEERLSFRWYCRELELDPDAVRQTL